ncbi:MAG: polysaccharide deacetylase family protein [Betaproteobacteria bacterium]|nr:polysaccharide deacetylase family protein [Betaproteobacteria bacterium]
MTEPFRFSGSNNEFRSSRIDNLATRLFAKLGGYVFPDAVHSRLSVLIFHRILPEPDPLLPYEVTARQFAAEIETLARHFTILPLREGLARLRSNTLPPYALCLTFDDGYRDNYTMALPILQAQRISATFFIASGYLDGGRMWNDTLLAIVRGWPDEAIDLSDWGIPVIPMQSLAQRQQAWGLLFRWMRRIGARGRDELLDRLARRVPESLPTDLMMTRQQVRELCEAGMEIGCHTRLHPILARLPDDDARAEIVGSKRELEELTQTEVRYFAYPNGTPGDDYGMRDVNLVAAAGFDAAFTTSWGVVTRDWDQYQIPRFTPWDRKLSRFTARFILSRSRMKPDRVSELVAP